MFMKISPHLERFFTLATDTALARWPRPAPASWRLAGARIVSHRGEHDNRQVFENTLAAFDQAVAAGVWGIEFDLRWTADGQAVVFHDPDFRRLAGCPMRLADATLAELRALFPPLPTLVEVVARYGKRCHLMIEIKAEPYPDPLIRSATLAHLLSPLAPVADYHLMSLDPGMLRHLGFVPRSCLVPIAWADVKAFSRLAFECGYGGVAGHFLLVGSRAIARHHQHGQAVGCGMVESRRCLYREIDRGVDWIFSNRAVELKSICSRHGEQHARPPG